MAITMSRRSIAVAVTAATLTGLAFGQRQRQSRSPRRHRRGAGAPPDQSAFQKVTLNDRPGEPISLAVLPDGRVLHTARTGEVRIHDPRTGLNPIAADVPVYQHDEEGLQGIAIDPNFERNHWVYLYYSPPGDTPVDDPATPDVNEGDAPTTGTAGRLGPLQGRAAAVAVQAPRQHPRGWAPSSRSSTCRWTAAICCHVGGQIDFDGRGNLYLSTGDDTNPFESDGYVAAGRPRRPQPRVRRPAQRRQHQRPARQAAADQGAARTAATACRGATCSRPARRGHAPRSTRWACATRSGSTSTPRPGTSTWPTTHPTPTEPDPSRGPAGQGRWMVIDRPGNYGWPFCVTPTLAYHDYDFATQTSGPAFNCAAAGERLARTTPAVVCCPGC